MPELVNLGSLCIDNVYAVPAIARGGETLTGQAPVRFAGGKGLNQSLAAARAGVAVAHVGCVGADGAWLKDLLADAGVDVAHVRICQTALTGHAMIQVTPQGENAIVIVGGANRQLQPADLQAAIERAGSGGWLLLQNEINDVDDVLAAAAQARLNVAFNVAPVDGREQRYGLDVVTLLLLNEIEAMALARESDAERALDRLTRDRPAQHVLITRGSAGLLYGRAETRVKLPAFSVHAVDETGAGDAFIGYLMAAWLQRLPLQQCLQRASAAGALAVQSKGAADSIPTVQAVRKFLADRL
jgi:ribokinase